ncbi:hypothetical protein AGMMS49574_28720 [Bacteroidia bacterium]|nr:hypothetical protein AGMMS49574_28720 [Bacteroidia bacterium]
MKKKFISPKFYFLLQEASQKGIDIDAQVLQNQYDEFAMLVYQEDAAVIDKAAYRNSLVHTRVELESLTGVSGKKCINLSA